MFQDKEVDKKVKYKLGIFDETEPAESDLDKVTDIIIHNVNAKGDVINTDLSELVRLKKLKTLDLKGFELTEEVLRVIQSFPELVSLKLYSCHSKVAIQLDIETLKLLVLDHCQSINLNETHLPETVLIIDGGVVDVSKFQYSQKLKELGINDSEIVHSTSLQDIHSLKRLNVDGSTLDDENIIDVLRSKKVAVSYELEYQPL